MGAKLPATIGASPPVSTLLRVGKKPGPMLKRASGATWNISLPLDSRHPMRLTLASLRMKSHLALAPTGATGSLARRTMRLRKSSECRLKQEASARSEEHTSELQSLRHLVCRLLLEKKQEQ